MQVTRMPFIHCLDAKHFPNLFTPHCKTSTMVISSVWMRKPTWGSSSPRAAQLVNGRAGNWSRHQHVWNSRAYRSGSALAGPEGRVQCPSVNVLEHLRTLYCHGPTGLQCLLLWFTSVVKSTGKERQTSESWGPTLPLLRSLFSCSCWNIPQGSQCASHDLTSFQLGLRSRLCPLNCLLRQFPTRSRCFCR